jgi:hypothetical protein
VRKTHLLSLILLALGLAACGGGGSSSSSGDFGTTVSAPQASGAPAAWAKEVEEVMRDFENEAAQLIQQIHTSTSQPRLEPLYREYGSALAKLGTVLEGTKAPAECVALRRKMGEDAAALAQLTKKLGHENQVNSEEFSALAAVQESKMHRYGSDLTKITYRPHC